MLEIQTSVQFMCILTNLAPMIFWRMASLVLDSLAMAFVLRAEFKLLVPLKHRGIFLVGTL